MGQIYLVFRMAFKDTVYMVAVINIVENVNVYKNENNLYAQCHKPRKNKHVSNGHSGKFSCCLQLGTYRSFASVLCSDKPVANSALKSLQLCLLLYDLY